MTALPQLSAVRGLTVLLTGLAAVLALAGCGDDEPSDEPTRTAANGDTINSADVRFATEMIQHHAQALSMVDLTLERPLSPDVERLVEDIRATQAPEIELMTDWLTAWDEPVPETVRDHANAHGEGEVDMGDMPGAMSAEDLHSLEDASDAEFQDRFLELMVEHHEGAVEMAKDELADGHFEPALELAGTIESSQAEEIDLMQRLLDR